MFHYSSISYELVYQSLQNVMIFWTLKLSKIMQALWYLEEFAVFQNYHRFGPRCVMWRHHNTHSAIKTPVIHRHPTWVCQTIIESNCIYVFIGTNLNLQLFACNFTKFSSKGKAQNTPQVVSQTLKKATAKSRFLGCNKQQKYLHEILEYWYTVFPHFVLLAFYGHIIRI